MNCQLYGAECKSTKGPRPQVRGGGSTSNRRAKKSHSLPTPPSTTLAQPASENHTTTMAFGQSSLNDSEQYEQLQQAETSNVQNGLRIFEI
jgi:hypothetical protein